MAISITPSPFGSVTVTLDGELGGVLSASILATSNSVLNMDLGVPGPQGEQGDPGANGVGVAAGGTTGQALVKLSGTNYDTGWATITSGGGTWGSITGTLSNQTDLQSALDAKLSLTGGSMSGDIAFLVDGNGDDTAVGSFGLGTENADGKVAYIEPTQIRIYDGSHPIGTSLNGTGITFNDETVQVTAGLPLTGGTMSGTINGYAWDGAPFSVTQIYDYNPSNPESNRYATAYIESTGAGGTIRIQGENGQSIGLYSNPGISYIQFGDDTQQSTAFIPANYLSTSAAYSTFLTQSNASSTYLTQSSAASTYFQKPTGTTSQYITGTGSLVTFPPVGDRYLTSSTSTLTVDSGDGKK